MIDIHFWGCHQEILMKQRNVLINDEIDVMIKMKFKYDMILYYLCYIIYM